MEFWAKILKDYSPNIVILVECVIPQEIFTLVERHQTEFIISIIAFHPFLVSSEFTGGIFSHSLAITNNFREHMFVYISRKSSRNTVCVCFTPEFPPKKFCVRNIVSFLPCHSPHQLYKCHFYHFCLVAWHSHFSGSLDKRHRVFFTFLAISGSTFSLSTLALPTLSLNTSLGPSDISACFGQNFFCG